VRDTEIIESIRSKLAVETGRHLYGVLGNYAALDGFAKKLRQARTADSQQFPKPLSVNHGILSAIPDDEFKRLVLDEARRPEPTAAHVAKAFETFLRSKTRHRNTLLLSNLELLFAYNVELNLLRTMAADDTRIILLLPGKRERGRVVMFPGSQDREYLPPINLIAENHLWELKG